MGTMLAPLASPTASRQGRRQLPDGVTHKDSHYAQQLSRHENLIIEVIADARKRGFVPLRSDVLKKVNVHVAQSTGEREWFTPPEYIDAARKVMGSIDIDPASCAEANKTVNAKHYYTAENNGLKKKWKGTVWLNPPYDHPIVDEFCQTLVRKVKKGETLQACIIVNNITETAAGQTLLGNCNAICFPKGRVRFVNPTKTAKNSPLQGQMVVYFGNNISLFEKEFAQFGVCVHGR